MTQQISPRDWEFLSAYLDRQLKPQEIASLEARLSTDPVLSAALGELQRTRNALRSLPKLRAPRNFTLTPQMAGQRATARARPALRLAPAFGFASALATFILIVVVIGDVLGILTPASKPVAQAPGYPSVLSQQATAPSGLEATAAPSLAQAPAAPQTTEAPLSAQAAVAPQETAAPGLAAQALAAPETPAETAPVQPKVGVVAPSQPAETTPGLSETLTNTITITASIASGMGGGPGAEENNVLPPTSTMTARGPEWVTTLQVTVSPTETLTFPMTITLEGSPITKTYDTTVENGWPVEKLAPGQATPTPTPQEGPTLAAPQVIASTETEAPAEAQAPAEAPVPAETSVPSQPELQARRSTPLSRQADTTPAASRPSAGINRSAVRIVEIALAALALLTGLAAGFFWLFRRA
jgi:anti-sigma factor RsiW